MRAFTLTVNGETHTLEVDPAAPLLYILRNDLGLRGPRFLRPGHGRISTS